MARRRSTADDTDPHGTEKPAPAEGATTVPVGPYPGLYGHPDVAYCTECARYAIGDMEHGPHPEAKK